MKKTYRHRTMGRTTNKEIVFDTYKVTIGGNSYYVDTNVIDDFLQDREEIVEKDWKENARRYYCNSRGYDEKKVPNYKIHFIEAIEKHCPKINKVTPKNIQDFVKQRDGPGEAHTSYNYNNILQFLRYYDLIEE